MNFFGNNKKDTGESSSSPVVSEKTKQSTGLLKKVTSKIGSLFSKTNIENTAEPMSNAKYLGEIYKLMVQNSVDIKLEREQQVNFREEEDSEEQKRHSEIIRALTIRRRPKPKAVIRREKKAEEKAAPTAPSMPGKPGKKPAEPTKPAETPKKPADPAKPAETPKKPADPAKPAETPKKPADPAKPAEKPVEKAKKEVDDGVKKAAEEKARKDAQEAAKKAAEEKAKKAAEEKAKKAAEEKAKKAAEEKAKKETAEKLKKEEQEKLKREAAEKAKAEKLKKDEPSASATQKPPASKKLDSAETATKIGIGTGIAAATTGLVPILAKAESPDYNLLVYPYKKKSGIKPPKPLTKMKIGEVLAFQDEMSKSKMYPSNAVGKYQIIQSTLKDGAEKLKIPLTQLFDEKTQDRLYYEYLTGSKRKDLGDYLSGKVSDTTENLAKAQLDLAKEFASFGVPHKVWRNEARKKKWPHELIWDARWIEPGQSYYVGAGGNKASVTPETSAKALKEERLLRLNKEKLTDVPSTPNSGTKAEQASKDNKDMKKQDTPAPINIQQNTTNMNNTTESSNAPKVDDRPAHQRK